MGVNIVNPPPADQRGWGPGWPHCQTEKWVPLEVESLRGGTVRIRPHRVSRHPDGHFRYEALDLPGGIRPEIHDLVVLLLGESERRGYINLHDGWCWAGACRPIKTSTGGLTDVASNHSWALAVDLNAPENGFGSSTHEIPEAMARLWNTYGFRWGGDYSGTKDWMHFEFCGTPADAKRLTDKARKELDDVALTDAQKDALEFAIGVQRYAESGPEPKEQGPRLRGYRWARRVATDPQPAGTAQPER